MKVLHLIDRPRAALEAERPGDPDAALLACSMLMERLPEIDQSIFLAGGSDLEERAAGVGLRATDRTAPPMGWTRRADRGLGAFLRDRGRPDVIHCWSPDAAKLARRFSGSVCLTALDRPGPPDTGPADRVAVVRIAPGIVEGSRGGAPAAIMQAALPRVDLALLPGAPAFGRSGSAEGAPVVLLLGGAPGEADAPRLAFLASLLHSAERPAEWVIPGSSARLARALRFHARSGRTWRLIVTERPLAEQVAAADLAVWLGPLWEDAEGLGPSAAGAVLIGAALGAGVPVVAPRSSLIEPLYSGAAGAECLGFNATLAELARKLLPLVGDSARREALRREVAARPWPAPELTFERVVAEQWRACCGEGARAYAQRP